MLRFMRCEAREHLLRAYRNDVKLYTFAVRCLHGQRSTVGMAAYEDLKRLSEDARKQCQASFAQLEDHTFKHGC